MLESTLKEQLKGIFAGLNANYTFDISISPAHESRQELLDLLGGCPDQCLIAVRVVNRLKGGFFSALDGGVLVERAGCVGTRF